MLYILREVYFKTKCILGLKFRFKFVVKGKSDSEYAKDESKKSVNRWGVWLFEAAIIFWGKMTPILALSITEAEFYAEILYVQDMMFVMRILNSLGIMVELPMVLEVDDKGASDIQTIG